MKYVSGNKIKNEGGNAVVAVLASIIVIGAYLQINGFGSINDSNQLFASARAREGRNAVAYQIGRFASLPITYRTSLRSSDNTDLKNCILGSAASLCENDKSYPVRLFSPSAGSSLGVAISGAGGSSPTLPVYYDLRGNPCLNATAASAACPFEVYTTFTPKCALGTATCTTAESVTVQYSVLTPYYFLAGASARVALSSVLKSSSPVAVDDIIPHEAGYTPSRLIAGSTVQQDAGSDDPKTIARAKVAAAVAAVVTDPILAERITRTIFDVNDIAREDLAAAIAKVWLDNENIALGLMWPTWLRRDQDYFTADNIARMGAAARGEVNGANTPSETLSGYIARAGIEDAHLAQQMIDALTSIPNGNDQTLIAVTTGLKITDTQLISSLDTVRVNLGYLDQTRLAPVAEYALNNHITDIQQLTDYARNLTIDPNASAPGPVASNPNPPSPTPTPPPVPGTGMQSCESAANCGTIPGI